MKKNLSNIKNKELETYFSFDDVLIKPKFSDVELDEIDLSTNISDKLSLKIPIIASPMDTVCGSNMAIAIGKLGGLGIIHRNQSIEDQVREVKRVLSENIPVGAALGMSSDYEIRAESLAKAGVSIFCMDYSIGHSTRAIKWAEDLKSKYKIDVIAGNIVTSGAIKDYLKVGINIFRYGSGAGSACISRNISGVGIPQLSALLETKSLAQRNKVSIISDGGIKTSGDITKALAAGANVVMIGSMLAGTEESLGKKVKIKGKLYKMYRGMGSLAAMKKGSGDRYHQENNKNRQPEGVENFIEYKGSLKDVIENTIYGLKTGMLKVGSKNIAELQKNAEFIRVISIK